MERGKSDLLSPGLQNIGGAQLRIVPREGVLDAPVRDNTQLPKRAVILFLVYKCLQ